VLHFGFSTTIDILDALVGRDHLKVIDTPQVGTTLVMGNTSIDLAGHFGGGEFLAVARNVGSGPHTEVTFVPYLPQLVEGRHVDPGAINGIASQLFMTGDGVVSFKATLQAAVSAFPNTLGWYKVGADGTIAGVHVLYANTQAPGAVTVDLGTPANGEKVAFFLVENGFGQFGVLPDNLSFVKADGVTPGNANQVGTLSLHSATLGTLNAAIFHTIANLNPGRAQQVLSGAMPGGHDLVLSFEDTAAAVGDNDFQDVVMSVHASRDDVYYLL
jgi:serralysin